MADHPHSSGEAPVRLSARHFRPGSRIPAARRPRLASTPKGSRRRKAGST
jgi:hypothetical protein